MSVMKKIIKDLGMDCAKYIYDQAKSSQIYAKPIKIINEKYKYNKDAAMKNISYLLSKNYRELEKENKTLKEINNKNKKNKVKIAALTCGVGIATGIGISTLISQKKQIIKSDYVFKNSKVITENATNLKSTEYKKEFEEFGNGFLISTDGTVLLHKN